MRRPSSLDGVTIFLKWSAQNALNGITTDQSGRRVTQASSLHDWQREGQQTGASHQSRYKTLFYISNAWRLPLPAKPIDTWIK